MLRITFGDVKNFFESQGCMLISTEFINSQTKLEYRCSKGHLCSMTWNNFQKGKRCRTCQYEQFAIDRKGEKSPLWKPNKTHEQRRFDRSDLEMRRWRNSIYQKDNYTCQCCHKDGGRLEAHHLYDYCHYPDLRYDMDNGITLCKKCHTNFHRIYGKHNGNTKEQFVAFKNSVA